jgi:hemin uptake protein HemP
MLEASSSTYHAPDTSPSASHATRREQGLEFDSRRLLQGQREIVIRHGGESYRLRHTRNDKLILTK